MQTIEKASDTEVRITTPQSAVVRVMSLEDLKRTRAFKAKQLQDITAKITTEINDIDLQIARAVALGISDQPAAVDPIGSIV